MGLCELSVDSLWAVCEPPCVSPGGASVETLWRLCGLSVDCLWTLCGLSVGARVETVWGLCV